MAFKHGASNLAIVVLCCLPSAAQGAGASRELLDSSLPGAAFTVTITLDLPPGVSVVAAEDAPPSGWTASSISDSGTFDIQTGKVKWGLFFTPSIPTSLTYDVTPTASPSRCFSGTVSFDGIGSAISGELCMNVVPAASTWGVLVMGISLLAGGAIAFKTIRRS
jgi:hypothetical protein